MSNPTKKTIQKTTQNPSPVPSLGTPKSVGTMQSQDMLKELQASFQVFTKSNRALQKYALKLKNKLKAWIVS